MIYNENLDRLMQVEIVKDFMWRQRFKVAPSDNDFGLILFRLPYVIEFKDALIENYLEVYFSDLEGSLYMEGSCALGCSLDLRLQNIEALRARDLTQDQNKEFFLSDCDLKIRHLYSNLEAIDKLLPLIDAKGGLVSIVMSKCPQQFSCGISTPVFSKISFSGLVFDWVAALF